DRIWAVLFGARSAFARNKKSVTRVFGMVGAIDLNRPGACVFKMLGELTLKAFTS
ncbi:MAG: hypothetical protein QOH24_1319, partial [Verrucomicrobiota bacterium]